MKLFDFDKTFSVTNLCGVDEAGRGPLAGPVVAAAVILDYANVDFILSVCDSKKISSKKRDLLYNEIVKCCKCFAVSVVDVPYIEKHNILNATMLAMSLAVEKLSLLPDLVLVDGNRVPALNVQAMSVVKGDEKSACVAAASVVAKVTRDKIMMDYDEEFPNYGFAKHKGYGTKLHYKNLEEFGPTRIHRMSFLKKKLKKI